MADENVEFLLSIIEGQLSRDEAVQLLKVRELRALSLYIQLTAGYPD
jgi:hypothetical protein